MARTADLVPPVELATHAAKNGKSPEGPNPTDPAALRAWLTASLGLQEAGLEVRAAEIFGRGPSAAVDVLLSGDRKITFERFGDISSPSRLSAHLVTMVGICRKFNSEQAGRVTAAIFHLGHHQAERCADEAAQEWGCEYLRFAHPLDVDLSDQADRWRAFSELKQLDPVRDAGLDRSAYAVAAAARVLVDRAGQRLVRSGWFQSYVRREVGGVYSSVALNTQMLRVGWERPNGEGRIKATSPADGRALGWSFFSVPEAWPGPEPGSGFRQVPPLNACAPAHAPGSLNPAGTRNLAENGHEAGL